MTVKPLQTHNRQSDRGKGDGMPHTTVGSYKRETGVWSVGKSSDKKWALLQSMFEYLHVKLQGSKCTTDKCETVTG